MRFQKGHVPHNKGVRFQKEKECENCSSVFVVDAPCRMIKRFCSVRCGMVGNKRRLGKKHTRETIQRISAVATDKRKTAEHRENIRKAKTGVKMPQITGPNHYLWITDRSLLKDNSRQRGGQLHREWSKQVKNRDKWKCVLEDSTCCEKVVAHHILSWAEYPDFRYKINNGITLCHIHHPRGRVDERKLVHKFQELVDAIVN